MGWWRIKDVETGQIDFDHKSPGMAEEGPVNAVPGNEPPNSKALYNGDGPADAMTVTLKEISEQYEKAWGRPASKDELTAVFNFVCNGRFRKEEEE